MSLMALFFINLITFVIIYLTLIFAFLKSKENVHPWSALVVILFIVLTASWYSDDMALQWVLIEASTLIGALLISMSRTEKSIEVAWKFLLLNSFGLGIAFLGLIVLSYAIHINVTMKASELIKDIHESHGLMVEIGLWLAIYGYSAKLGLFPNHFWVSDTYAESPSQISSAIASFLPIAVSIAMRPLIQMDLIHSTSMINSVTGLFVMGVITMFYSIWTIYHTNDIRRITAQIALFHSGSLAVFLCLNPSDTIFYFVLASNLTVKALLFFAMGILRIDAETRMLNEIQEETGLSKTATSLYIASFGMAFVLPLSPIFLSDLLLIQIGLNQLKYWIVVVPILGLIFFVIGMFKILPIMNIPSRKFLSENRRILNIRVFFTSILISIILVMGVYGLFMFSTGGFL
ncbi:MAG: formate hydrogenase [Leptospiraceae bacterium]|nr:formate hydrogenase [Leptospiraceae bacterium]MCP5493422.1 formate hydrogenase [Leptospiraceae bacterium]